MFERYTHPARRVIFFARFEAGQLGAEKIGTEHLLLGLTQEHPGLLTSVVGAGATEGEIRRRLNLKAEGESLTTSVDMPLTNPSKRVLAYAAEEAERLGDKQISAAHLLQELMREQGCEAERVLKEMGRICPSSGSDSKRKQPSFVPR
jgi:ATP-dependent Clp protease ATP-binding subunit ClpC